MFVRGTATRERAVILTVDISVTNLCPSGRYCALSLVGRVFAVG